MAAGMSNANARQGKANEGRNNRYKNGNVAEINKVHGILKHMKRVLKCYPRIEVKGGEFTTPFKDNEFETEFNALNRLAGKIGIGRVRSAIESRGVKLG